MEQVRQFDLSGVLVYAFVGGILVGLALAIVGAAMVYLSTVIKQRFLPAAAHQSYVLPDNAPPWWHATERVATRYAPLCDSTPAQRSRFHYVRVKLLMDPVTKMIANLLGEHGSVLGKVIDIGTGRGQLPIVLLELERASRVYGLDWDEEKIAAAKEAVQCEPPLNATFVCGDAVAAELPAADTVLLIDLLHYLTVEEQDQLLRRAAEAVSPGGRIIVREADTDRGWRSWTTLIEEKVFTLLRFNRGARVKFRAAKEITTQLEAAGLTCEVRPAWGKTPFSNVLIIGRREP